MTTIVEPNSHDETAVSASQTASPLDAAVDAAVMVGAAWLGLWVFNRPDEGSVLAQTFWAGRTPLLVLFGAVTAAAIYAWVRRSRGFLSVPQRWAGFVALVTLTLWINNDVNASKANAVHTQKADCEAELKAGVAEKVEFEKRWKKELEAKLEKWKAASEEDRERNRKEIERLQLAEKASDKRVEALEAEYKKKMDELARTQGESAAKLKHDADVERENNEKLRQQLEEKEREFGKLQQEIGEGKVAATIDPAITKPDDAFPAPPESTISKDDLKKLALAFGPYAAAVMLALDIIFKGLSASDIHEAVDVVSKSTNAGKVNAELAKQLIAGLKSAGAARAVQRSFEQIAAKSDDPAEKAAALEAARAAEQRAEELQQPNDINELLETAWSKSIGAEAPTVELLVSFYDEARTALRNKNMSTDALVDQCAKLATNKNVDKKIVEDFRKEADK